MTDDDDTAYVGPAPRDQRMLGVGLAVAAAVLLLLAALSRSWLLNPQLNDLGFGPIGCHDCCLTKLDDVCTMSNADFVDQLDALAKVGGLPSRGFRNSADPAGKLTSGAFAPMGWATFGLCVIAGLALLATAVLAYLKRRPELPISPPTIAMLAIMIAMITGCVFVATKPGPAGFVGVAWGFWSFGAGTVMGIAAAQMLAKVIRPLDPDLLSDSMNPEHY